MTIIADVIGGSKYTILRDSRDAIPFVLDGQSCRTGISLFNLL
ncbi:MAG: hypothetical protein ACE3JK_03095 [Sporolactobacillus sp.]